MSKLSVALVLSLLFLVTVTAIEIVEDSEGDILNLVPPPDPQFNNNSGAVNSSTFADIWLTNEGQMDNVPDLYPTTDARYVEVAGDLMTGQLAFDDPDYNISSDGSSEVRVSIGRTFNQALFTIAGTMGGSPSLRLCNDLTCARILEFVTGQDSVIEIIRSAGVDVRLFGVSSEGTTKSFSVYGFPTGLSLAYGAFQVANIDGKNAFVLNGTAEQFHVDMGLSLNGTVDLNSHNLTEIGELQAPDGSVIRFSAPSPFTTFDQAIVIGNNQSLGDGVISHALLDINSDKVIEAWQVGKPESAGYHRNSYIISGDYGSTNSSVLTSCPDMIAKSGATARVGCNTSDIGAGLYVEGSTQVSHSLFIGGGNKTSSSVLGVNLSSANFVMDESVFNIVDGDASIENSKIVTTGFDAGDRVDLFNVDFETATLDPFVSLTPTSPAIRQWTAVSEVQCHAGFCASARGGNVGAERIMEANITTADFDDLNMSFWLTRENVDAGEYFNVTANNNVGSGEVNLFGTSDGTDQADVFVNFIMPSSMENQSSVSLRFIHSASGQEERSWVDEVLVNGNATASTSASLTFFDGRLNFGDGTCFIYVNGTSNNMTISCDHLNLPASTTVDTSSFLKVDGTRESTGQQNFTGGVNIPDSSNITIGSEPEVIFYFDGTNVRLLDAGQFADFIIGGSQGIQGQFIVNVGGDERLRVSNDGVGIAMDNTGEKLLEVTGGIFATGAQSIFGNEPEVPASSNTQDRLISTHTTSSTSGTRRGFLAVGEYSGTSGTVTTSLFGANTFCYTMINSEGVMTSNNACVGNRATTRIRGATNLTGATGVLAGTVILGAGSDGIAWIGTGYKTEIKGGSGTGFIDDARGLWIPDSVGNVNNFTGILIDDLSNAGSNKAIKTGAGDIELGAININMSNLPSRSNLTTSMFVCWDTDGTLFLNETGC